ncbi:phosphatidic acid phosphatase type 2/haloperoxidase [Paenibacillus naphthalenovorans]|uniref:Phosphatidic acid phosphatase type 2/haloperoxidase n=2 Tax=Paenibacillus naphthalenovorans TaxID=162209 RepID=A0A0U2KZL6_9BACL|nr:phosphatidic acid phosphatase type 2/haloperoxidase [Paenibacillus naphthalenovorans]SDH85884.1 undecaprenyl-diphosphatase [Paenibacillus naphthalenovorans]
MILGVGYSRVYFGVHYITDIAAGYLAGLFCISTAFLIIRDKRTAISGYRYISSYRN